MHPIDPFEQRRRGDRRVRAVTVAVAGTAVLGAGALAFTVAHETAQATTTATTDAGTSGTGTSSGTGTGTAIAPPAQLPGSGSLPGGTDASSGGS